jgi:signal transduction histidine kinase
MGIWPVACHDSVVGGSRRTAAVWIVALALGAIGAGFGLLTLAEARSAPGLSFAGTSWVGAVAELTAGWALIAAGVAETWRRPASRAGLLLAGAGIGWFFAEWNNPGLGSPAAFTFGLIASALAAPLVAHAALAYPTGRLDSRLDLCVLVFAYAGAGLVLGLLPALFFDPGRQGCSLCPANLVLARSEPGLVGGLQRAGLVLGLVWAAGLVAAGARRLGKASPPLRRRLWPVLVPAGCYLVLVGADFAHSLPRGTLSSDPLEYRLWLGEAALLVLMAAGVAWAWVRDRRTRSAVVRLVMDAAQSPPAGGLREVLAGMLGDSGLMLTYPVGEPPRNVNAGGQPASVEPDEGQAATPLARDRKTVAVLRHRAGLLDDPGLVGEVVAAARLGMENERLHAEVLAQLEDLRAAQARIVATGDAERRRLERDLHDGAQQRLVGLSLALRLTGHPASLGPDQYLTGLIDKADRELRLAIDELRELAHGIYPAVLADEGLAAAVEAFAESASIPVMIGDLPDRRFPGPVEAAGYFLVAEATPLLADLAGANAVTVEAKQDGSVLAIHLAGCGGAEPGQGLEAGLVDVADRVGALGGQFRVERTPGEAVTIRAEIPCGS